eukprot:1141460-Pelagomonas_calceolata.AAC.5
MFLLIKQLHCCVAVQQGPHHVEGGCLTLVVKKDRAPMAVACAHTVGHRMEVGVAFLHHKIKHANLQGKMEEAAPKHWKEGARTNAKVQGAHKTCNRTLQ